MTAFESSPPGTAGVGGNGAVPGPDPTPRWGRAVALGVLVAAAGALAVLLHRTGHTQGDDFALYLRQARALIEGDIGAVVADNRFTALNSDVGVTPYTYPWGWPIVLAPFVEVWGLDYDRLKLLVVAAFCIWLVLLHGIVRRRLGHLVATVFVAVFATASLYLAHTDQLLSEYPHMVAVAIVIWWYDRLVVRGSLLEGTIRDLTILGLLLVVAFNFRREVIVMIPILAVMMTVDVWRAAEPGARRGTRRVGSMVRGHAGRLAAPFVAFGVGLTLFQWVLPAHLFPGFGTTVRRGFGNLADDGRSSIDNRVGEVPGILTEHLGFGERPALGVALLGLAAIGAALAVWRRPRLDLPLVLLVVCTALVLADRTRKVDRYWLQLLPLISYFVVVALLAAVAVVVRHRRRVAEGVVALALGALVVADLVVLADEVGDVQDLNSAGQVQVGPTHPLWAPMFDAVIEVTPPDAVVAYYRARTMTLLTDRRSFQTYSADRIAANADYFVQRRGSTFWQPALSETEAADLGFRYVWSNSLFTIWATDRWSPGALRSGRGTATVEE